MTIPVFDWLWRKLDGPLIKAIVTCITEWFRSFLEPNMEYFQNLTLDDSSEQHLILQGLIRGLPRPYVWNISDLDIYFRFAPNLYGLRLGFDTYPRSPIPIGGYGLGGILDNYPRDGGDLTYGRLPTPEYRALLIALAASDADFVSLDTLDLIIWLYTYGDIIAPGEAVYSITWIEDNPAYVGDFNITLDKIQPRVITSLEAFQDLFAPEFYYSLEIHEVLDPRPVIPMISQGHLALDIVQEEYAGLFYIENGHLMYNRTATTTDFVIGNGLDKVFGHLYYESRI